MEETQAYEMGLLLAVTTCLGCVEGSLPAVWDRCTSWCSKDLFVALGPEVEGSSSDPVSRTVYVRTSSPKSAISTQMGDCMRK